MKDTLDLIYVVVLIFVAIGSFFGANAYFSRRVNRNFDEKYQADKEERDAAKKEADEREAARMTAIINLQEGFVAVGHVAQKTAEAHLARCGPDKEITKALDVYCDVRMRHDSQLRTDAAKYSQTTVRAAP